MDEQGVGHTHAHVRTCTHTHTRREYYSAMGRMEILPRVTTWMDHDGTVLSEMSGRGGYCMVSLICGITKSQTHPTCLLYTSDAADE